MPVRKALNVNGIGQQIVKGKHVGEGRTASVQLGGNLLKGRPSRFVVALAKDLVAKTPHNDAGMISVAEYQICHVLHVGRIVVKEAVLVNDHHAQAIVNIQDGRVGGIVRGPAGVATDAP